MYVLDIHTLDVYRKSMCAYVHGGVCPCAWGVYVCVHGRAYVCMCMGA